MSSRRSKRRRAGKEWKDAHPPVNLIVGNLPEATLDALRSSEMPSKYNHLDSLLEHEVSPSVLRLVGPEEGTVAPEPGPARCDEPIERFEIVPDAGRPVEESPGEAGEDILVASIDPEPTDRIAEINPVPIELGYYLVEIDPEIQANLNAYQVMFLTTDCLGLLTKGTAFYPWIHQFDVKEVGHWELSYNDWIRATPDLITPGKLFWYKLSDTFELPMAEKSHLVRLGALAEMLYAGQLDKAVALYNGWARFAGYGEIALKSHNPPIVDIGIGLLQITNNNFKVILVR